jgi:hypothetical protein
MHAHTGRLLLLLTLLLAACQVPPAPPPPAQSGPTLVTDVPTATDAPILLFPAYLCHGRGHGNAGGSYNLDRRDALWAGGDAGCDGAVYGGVLGNGAGARVYGVAGAGARALCA